MPTVEDLGRKVKAKYKQYQHLSDIEAGHQVKADYPGAYEKYQDIEDKPTHASKSSPTKFQQAMRQLDNRPTQEANTGLEQNVESLIGKYDSKQGSLSAWFREVQSHNRGAYLASLNEEQRLLIEQAVMMEKAVMEGRKDAAMFNTVLAQNANFFLLLEAASEQKLPPEIYAEIRKQEELARIEVQKSQAETDLIIRTSMLGKDLATHQELALLQELVNNCYLEMERIEKLSLSQPIKDRMIQDQEDQITTLKGDMSVRRNRLAQISDGENIRGSLSFTDVEGSDSEPA